LREGIIFLDVIPSEAKGSADLGKR